MKAGPHVLVIAGSDSSGGAGIARDIATLAHFGLRASLALTAVSAQTHAEVVAVESMPASLVAAQVRAAFAASEIAAVKIGMLATAEIVYAVADVLAGHGAIPVVVDPVLASTSGARLLSNAGIECLRERLLPLSSLVTPNLPELCILAERSAARSDTETAAQATRLLNMGSPNVLVKGGHAQGPQSVDILYTKEAVPRHFASPRREVALRGTGCMLSSAIAAHLALGHATDVAISKAKAFLDQRFESEGDQSRN